MTSPSTLVRKAAKAKSAATAERLRAEAAKLRREARQHRATAGTLRAEAEELATKVRSHVNEVTTRTLDMQPQSAGGWSELRESDIMPEHNLELLRKLARKKPKAGEIDNDGFGIALRASLVTAKHHGRRQTEEAEHEKRKAIYDANRIAVVSGFIATVEAHAKRQGGELNPVITLSGYTVARVIEALRLAGYTENGKGAPRRE